MNVKPQLQKLTAAFVDSIVQVLRVAQSEERADASAAARTTKTGRLARRSVAEIAACYRAVAQLIKQEGPQRSEVIRAELNFDVREMPRILREGVAAGAIKILSGQKRSTTYGVGAKNASGKAAKKAKPAAKKGAKKPAKKGATKAWKK